MKVLLQGRDIAFKEPEERAVHSGRRGTEAMVSFSNWAAKLEIFRSFMMVELLVAEVSDRIHDLRCQDGGLRIQG